MNTTLGFLTIPAQREAAASALAGSPIVDDASLGARHGIATRVRRIAVVATRLADALEPTRRSHYDLTA